jgi:hypothetical protein
MRRGKGWLVSLMVLGPALLVAPASIGVAAASTAQETRRPLVDWNCLTAGRVKPTRIVLACGDGNTVANHLRWEHWTNSGAIAVGLLKQNTCVPDCADGTFHEYPATFTLSEGVPVGEQRYFTRVTIAFTRASPAHRKVEVVKDCFDNPPSSAIPKCPADLQD